MIAEKQGITDKEAFDISREELLQTLPSGDKHNSLYDAKVIKLLYYKLS